MKNLLFAIPLLLISCGGSTLSYDYTIRTDEESIRTSMEYALERVVERKVAAIEGGRREVSVDGNTVTIESSGKFDHIIEPEITRPLDLRLMREANEDETPDLMNERYGNFMDLGITENDVYMASTTDGPDGTGIVTINFTDEGKAKLKSLFEDIRGTKIGLFLRGGLASAYTVNEEGLVDNIVIAGVPTKQLADIFADDVNTGVYVVFEVDEKNGE